MCATTQPYVLSLTTSCLPFQTCVTIAIDNLDTTLTFFIYLYNLCIFFKNIASPLTFFFTHTNSSRVWQDFLISSMGCKQEFWLLHETINKDEFMINSLLYLLPLSRKVNINE